jgi:hypothetical protein
MQISLGCLVLTAELGVSVTVFAALQHLPLPMRASSVILVSFAVAYASRNQGSSRTVKQDPSVVIVVGVFLVVLCSYALLFQVYLILGLKEESSLLAMAHTASWLVGRGTYALFRRMKDQRS